MCDLCSVHVCVKEVLPQPTDWALGSGGEEGGVTHRVGEVTASGLWVRLTRPGKENGKHKWALVLSFMYRT